jgi:hypothetical protein
VEHAAGPTSLQAVRSVAESWFAGGLFRYRADIAAELGAVAACVCEVACDANDGP